MSLKSSRGSQREQNEDETRTLSMSFAFHVLLSAWKPRQWPHRRCLDRRVLEYEWHSTREPSGSHPQIASSVGQTLRLSGFHRPLKSTSFGSTVKTLPLETLLKRSKSLERLNNCSSQRTKLTCFQLLFYLTKSHSNIPNDTMSLSNEKCLC